ncbi:IS4 family transposase [Fimbriiglobus ruber]
MTPPSVWRVATAVVWPADRKHTLVVARNDATGEITYFLTNAAAEPVARILAVAFRRWTVEIFFRTLKSGCRIERRRFEHVDRVLPCVALYLIVAWRTLFACRMGREHPDQDCEAVFEPSEWKAVWVAVHREAPPDTPPRLGVMVELIATRGGYIPARRPNRVRKPCGSGSSGCMTWRGRGTPSVPGPPSTIPCPARNNELMGYNEAVISGPPLADLHLHTESVNRVQTATRDHYPDLFGSHDSPETDGSNPSPRSNRSTWGHATVPRTAAACSPNTSAAKRARASRSRRSPSVSSGSNRSPTKRWAASRVRDTRYTLRVQE